ncbi:hypothetical protein SAMN04244572_04923 [Azotobacter beijerinckii]|uniref:Uncharacterized protein n=1 Tax=Azotobacter beijerinckii TaxID=170623 RepID=A0A1H7B4L1_9GAMM|nr:hypothetical protein SAMN04244572_04923 [Azotobacter beijerinckii]
MNENPGPGPESAFSYILAQGRPDLIPELTYILTGIKGEIAAITWLGAHVAHSFTADAYTTSLELECFQSISSVCLPLA